MTFGTQKKIYQMIHRSPGLHLRELKRRASISSGQLQHHVKVLEKQQLIKIEKAKGSTRLFPMGLNDYERNILGVLRQKTCRKIALLLLEKNATNKEVASALKTTPSTATWHLNQLQKKGIIVTKRKGREKHYSLKQKNEVAKIIIAYQESFIDKLVDKFVSAWENE